MAAFQAPKHIQRTKTKTTSFHGRGVRFEETINRANVYYITNQIASIHKKPTPIQVVSVSYPKRSAAKIVEAYYKTPSTTDYNGVYRGKHIDFEAKETENTTRFPLQNILTHQIEHLKLVQHCGGISFLLVSFTKLQRIFLLDVSHISQEIQKKSYISLSFFEEHGIEIENSNQLYLNYLYAVDILIDQKELNYSL